LEQSLGIGLNNNVAWMLPPEPEGQG
jgi:hypothetical protein